MSDGETNPTNPTTTKPKPRVPRKGGIWKTRGTQYVYNLEEMRSLWFGANYRDLGGDQIRERNRYREDWPRLLDLEAQKLWIEQGEKE